MLRPMKWLRIFTGIAVLLASRTAVWSQGRCTARVQSEIRVSSDAEFSLADLLAADACPELRRSAAAVRMGRAPLAGSVRVIKGDEVRGLLTDLIAATNKGVASF